MGGVEYQVTKVDPTNPETKGMVYQVHKVTEEVAATLGGKVYRARIIKDPSDPAVAGKVYQIVLIGDPDNPSVKGKVYNAILTGDSEVVVIGPAVSPLTLPDAIADSLSYVKAFGGTEQRNLPDGYIERQFIYMMDGSYLLTDIVPTYDCKIEMDFQITNVPTVACTFLGGRTAGSPSGFIFVKSGDGDFAVDAFGGTRYNSGVTPTVNTRYKFIYDNQTATLTSGGSTLFTNTFTGTDATGAALCINAVNNNGTVIPTQLGTYLYSFRMWNAQGELVADYVPAVQKGTVPVVGFYDTVTDTFKTATAGTFAAGGEAVPTPDTPMDIVSNNGVLKARHQSGLPLGYTLLDYITFTGTQYINTGLAINNNTRVLFDAKRSTSSAQANYPWLGGSRDYVNNTNINKKTLEFSKSDSTRMYLQYATAGEITLIVPDTTQRHTYDFDKNKLYVDENLIYTATQETFTGNAAFLIGTVYAQGSVATASMFYGNVYGFKLWQDGTNLSMNLIPAKRNSDNVVGMYDLVSGQFFTNAGTGTFTAGDPVSDPVEVYADGTVETIEDTIGNTATAEMLLKVGDYQDVQSIIDGVVTRNIGVKVLDGTEDWTFVSGTSPYFRAATDIPFADITFDETTELCSHFPIVVISTSTQYQGIRLGQRTASLPLYMFFRYNDLIPATGSNVSQLKTWLATQYNAGTPVMIIYPLATPTTESVTGQTLQVTDGDNVLEITQASLNNLELEAKYQKSA